MKKKNIYLLNAIALISITLIGYLLTQYMYVQKPNIITQPEAPVEAIQDAKQIPDFSFKTLDGAAHNIRDYKDKIILLNFWATWCAPCVREFPNLLKTAENHPNDVVLIALSSDLDKAAITNFAEKFELDIQRPNVLISLDEDNITQSTFQTFKLPETIIIDKNQNMRKKLIGADWDIEYLEKEIKKLL